MCEGKRNFWMCAGMFLTWMLIVCLTGHTPVLAANYADGDFKYAELEDGTLKLEQYTGSNANVQIPSEYAGKKVTVIGDYSFTYNTTLKSVAIPDSVTSIEFAFSGCSALEQIDFGNGVAEIGEHAFSFCSQLKEIKIPGNIKTVGGYAFMDSGLESVEFCEGVLEIKDGAFLGNQNLETVTFGSTVTEIGKLAFDNDPKLKYVFIPANLTHIGKSAFAACLNLTAFSVDSENKAYMSRDGALFSKNGKTLIQYPAGKKTDSYAIPDEVEWIQQAAFASCSMRNIQFPEHLKKIDDIAFSGAKIQRAVLPKSVSYIGGDAFACDQLKSITILNSKCKILAGENDDTISTKAVIYGEKGSTAQKYAKKHKIKFEVLNKNTCKHQYQKYTTAATLKKNGKVEKRCVICNASKDKKTIYAPKTMKLSKTSYVYDGKEKKPSVTITDTKGKKISKKYYKVSYQNNKNAGKASVTVEFSGKYFGTMKKSFQIKSN